ncbi:hypothetical protein NHX12_014419 [Muraenolepis orangiensis]|uniref:Uncharacterized protein n=1 Tax=Muraenolepis orangiensis TaxID=630683 RepID=A0A9Q0I564_9TELE|nr:hypothetical protein NHX12_014419 [Muraenolepis orangiensis]
MTEPGWDKETIAQSASLKQKLEDFDFTFLLRVFQFIFGLTEPFQVLQSKTVDIKKCQDRIMSTLSALKATRTDETFSRIYDETGKAVGEPVPRRKRGGRGWEDLEQGFNQHQEGDQETLVSFRRLYFQIVDGVVLHMTQRFADMEHLNFFRILEHTSFASFCKPAAFPSSELAQLINTYPFFDQQKLRNELHTLYNNRLFHKPPGQLIELLIEDDLQGTLSQLPHLRGEQQAQPSVLLAVSAAVEGARAPGGKTLRKPWLRRQGPAAAAALPSYDVVRCAGRGALPLHPGLPHLRHEGGAPGTRCKYIICRHCRVEFCFVCPKWKK